METEINIGPNEIFKAGVIVGAIGFFLPTSLIGDIVIGAGFLVIAASFTWKAYFILGRRKHR